MSVPFDLGAGQAGDATGGGVREPDARLPVDDRDDVGGRVEHGLEAGQVVRIDGRLERGPEGEQHGRARGRPPPTTHGRARISARLAASSISTAISSPGRGGDRAVRAGARPSITNSSNSASGVVPRALAGSTRSSATRLAHIGTQSRQAIAATPWCSRSRAPMSRTLPIRLPVPSSGDRRAVAVPHGIMLPRPGADALIGRDASFCDPPRRPSLVSTAPGGMPERTNGTVSKTVEAFGSPWVQIPLPPPTKLLVRSGFARSPLAGRFRFGRLQSSERRTFGVPERAAVRLSRGRAATRLGRRGGLADDPQVNGTSRAHGFGSGLRSSPCPRSCAPQSQITADPNAGASVPPSATDTWAIGAATVLDWIGGETSKQRHLCR